MFPDALAVTLQTRYYVLEEWGDVAKQVGAALSTATVKRTNLHQGGE